jgi:hypothetical protein
MFRLLRGHKTMVEQVNASIPVVFSYKFQARLEPKWHAIIKKVFGLGTEKEQLAFGAKLSENPHEERMIGRRYDFTEFFDSSSGLTMRFQRTNTQTQSWANFVGDFIDRGYLLEWGTPLMPEERRHESGIEISESEIRIGCNRDWGLRQMEGERLFVIPINEMIEFSVALQLKFPYISTKQIVKWPEKIDNKLKKLGVTYNAGFADYEPEFMNIEKEDATFFSEHGRPQIATTESHWPSFDAEYAYYGFEVEVFTPDRARSMSRLAGTHLLPSAWSNR